MWGVRVTCQISVVIIILINLDPLTRTKVDVTVDSYEDSEGGWEETSF